MGENMQLKWLRTIMILILYLVTAFGWIGWTLFLVHLTSTPDAPDFFVQFVMSAAVFIIGAVISYRRYKPRLDAVGITFR